MLKGVVSAETRGINIHIDEGNSSYLFLCVSRVVESESESGVGVGGVACFELESESGVGVGFQNCWSRESESVFKTAGVGVGVGFLKLVESESVFQNCWSRSQESESEHLLQLPTPMFIK